MEFIRFLRVLRRRWRLVASLVLVGTVLGFVPASVAEEVDPIPVQIVRYKASHTLIVNANLPTDVDVVDVRNLEQIAQRVTQGSVPTGVAEDLGTDPREFAIRTSIVVGQSSQTLEITAIGETATAAEEHANDLAAALLEFLASEAAVIHQQGITAIQARVDAARTELATVREARSNATAIGTQAQLLEEEQRLSSTLSREEAALSRKVAGGAPIVPLESLEEATAVEISEAAYNAALRAGALGNNIQTGLTGSIFGDEAAPRQSGLPIPSSPLGRAFVGALAGFLLAVAIVLVLDRMDPRLRTKHDVEEALDLQVVAEIPPLDRRQQRETEVLAFTAPRSRAAEAYRVLRSSLDYARSVTDRKQDGAHVVLITSPGPSEGKTTSVANAAVVLAEADKEVLVVNCDFRRPRLTDYLGGEDEVQRVNLTSVPGVHLITHVLPEGDHTPAEVLAAQRRVIERARDRFDVILLDTAPLLTTNDATDILEVTDHVVLVVSADRTTREAADRAVELLERRNASTLGVVLIGARDVPNAREYYYDGDDPYLTRSNRASASRQSPRVDRSGSNRSAPSGPRRTEPSDIEALRETVAADPGVPASTPERVPASSGGSGPAVQTATRRPSTGRQPVSSGKVARSRDRRPPLQIRTVRTREPGEPGSEQ